MMHSGPKLNYTHHLLYNHTQTLLNSKGEVLLDYAHYSFGISGAELFRITGSSACIINYWYGTEIV